MSGSRRYRLTASRGACVLCVLLALAACSAPQRRPPSVALRESAPLAGLPTDQHGWPAAQWWKEFHDAQLDALMDLASAHAPQLDVAQARYRSAVAGASIARAEARPQLNGIASASRAHIVAGNPKAAPSGAPSAAGAQSGAQGGFMLPSYVTSIAGIGDFSYDFDWWGKHRAAIESALDKQHAALAERSAAAASIESAVASTYFDWLSIRLRLAQAAQTTDVNAALLRIAQARVQRGIDPPQTVEAARQQLAGARAATAQLEGAAQGDRAALAASCGVALAELPPLTVLPLPTLDTALPEDARVALLARRPDIVASRWMVESSARDIDQARSAFFPDISISALAGFLRSYPTPGRDSTLRFGSAGLMATLPLYDGGRRSAQFDATQAALDEAIAQYNATVMDAAQDVSRQTVALGALAAQRVQKRVEVAAAESAYAQANARARRGVDDPRQTLAAQAQLIAQHDAALQLDAQTLGTDIALIHALGGGYRSAIDAQAAPGELKTAAEDAP